MRKNSESSDVWYDSDDEQSETKVSSERLISQNNLEKQRQIYEKFGYREGIDYGKEESTQKGYDDAFRGSALRYIPVGERIGKLKTLREIHKLQGQGVVAEIEEALEELGKVGDKSSFLVNSDGELELTNEMQKVVEQADVIINKYIGVTN